MQQFLKLAAFLLFVQQHGHARRTRQEMGKIRLSLPEDAGINESSSSQENDAMHISKQCLCSSEDYDATPQCSAAQCSSRRSAKQACESQVNVPVVPEISEVPMECSHTGDGFCCKKVDASQIESYEDRTAQNLESFRDWLLLVHSTLDHNVKHMEKRLNDTSKSGRVRDEDMEILNKIFHPGISDLTLDFTVNIVRCAMVGTENVDDGCANYVAYSAYAHAYGNKLLSLFYLFHKLIDVAAYGHELTGPMGFLHVGVLELLKGRVVTKTLFPVLKSTVEVLKKQRMLILVGVTIAAQAVPMAQILATTISLTRPGQGVGVMLTTLIRAAFWRILCPALFNPLLMGAVVQWVVQHIILSDQFQDILGTIVSSKFSRLVDAAKWLQNKVRQNPDELQNGDLETNWRHAVKKWGDDHEGLAYGVYTLMWTMVSHVFNIVGRVACAAATGVSDVATLAENEAEALTSVSDGGLQRVIRGMGGLLKRATPGEPGLKRQEWARSTMRSMDELQRSLPGAQSALTFQMQVLNWVLEKKVNVVHMSLPVLQNMLRILGSTAGVISCIVMFVGHHIDGYFENREKILDAAELHNLINGEKTSELETQVSIRHWGKADHNWSEADRIKEGDELAAEVTWDRKSLYNLDALKPVERALRYATAELKKIPMYQVPRAPHAPPEPLASPYFVELYPGAHDAGLPSAAVGYCFERRVKYLPLNLPGTEREYAPSEDACQERCRRNMPRCAHFNWWAKDGGCHITGEDAKPHVDGSAVSGPPEC